MKKLLAAAVLTLAMVAGAQAAIIVQSTAGASESGDPVGTITIADFETTAATDLLLVGFGGMYQAETVLDSLTFGGTALTEVPGSAVTDDESWDQEVRFYYLESPGAVTGDVVYTNNTSRAYASVVAYAIDGVGIGGLNEVATHAQDGSASSISTDIAAGAGSLVIDFLATDDADGHTAASGQTVAYAHNGDKSQSSGYFIADEATETVTWDYDVQNDGEGAHSVLAFVPEPATLALVALGLGGTLLRRRRR